MNDDLLASNGHYADGPPAATINTLNRRDSLILERLATDWGYEYKDNGRARCPGHDGTDKNLAVHVADGKVLLYCHSYGCTYDAILQGLGIAHETELPATITRATDDKFTVEQRTWLVDELIQEHHLCLFAGDAGQGKSKMAAKLIAAVTTGQGFAGRNVQQGDVLLYSAEDHFNQDTLPALINEGADLDKLHILEGDLDLAAIEAYIHKHTLKLVVLDPCIDAVLSSKGSANDPINLRRALKPIQNLCTSTGATVVGLVHFRKADGSGQDAGTALQRISGSGVWGQVARSVLAFAPSKDHPPEDAIKIMVQAKSQQARMVGGWTYHIGVDDALPHADTAICVLDDIPIAGSPEELLAGKPKATQKSQCIDDLVNYLVDDAGWCKRRVIEEHLLEEHSKGTVNHAFTEIRRDPDKNRIEIGAREHYGQYRVIPM